MTNPTQTLLIRAAELFGDEVTWVMPEADAVLREIKNLRAVQPFRPDYLALEKMGVAVSPVWPQDKTPTIAITLPRQAEWAFGLIAQALARLPENGGLLVAAHINQGGKRYAKTLETHFGLFFGDSKSHCRLAGVTRPAELPPVVDEWLKAYAPQTVKGTALVSLPGAFSHGHVDEGSALLARHLPPLAGRIADFGAGWGYLAHHVLSSEAPPAHVDVFEADMNALDMAKRNLEAFKDRAAFFWRDVTQEEIAGGYDAVIMNPPFHDLRDARTEIGRSFISAASQVLKSGGRLWMVANVHLPYEETLKIYFAAHETVARENGFKVLRATK